MFTQMWLGKYDFTKQGVILFVCPRLVHLPIKRMPLMRGWMLSGRVRPIMYESEMENYARVDIMVSFYSLTPNLN